MTLPAFAAAGAGACSRYRSIAGTRHPQLSIDVCCPRPSSAESQPHAAAAVDRRDRQTDGLPTVTQTLLRIRCGQRKQQNVTLRHPSRAHSQDNATFIIITDGQRLAPAELRPGRTELIISRLVHST